MTTSTIASPTQLSEQDRPITVLEDLSTFNIKHPLQYTWNLWLKDGSANAQARPGRPSAPTVTSGNWKDQLQDIDAITTVEDFWGIPKASAIADASDYFLFKEGIAPEWEDEAHLNGGSLTFNLPRGPQGSRWQCTDDCWLNAMLACVGCQFENHEHVTGVQFACRERGSRIILWMRTSQVEIVQSIQEDFLKALQEGLFDLGNSIRLQFDVFAEKKAKSALPRRNPSSSNRHSDRDRDHQRRYFN